MPAAVLLFARLPRPGRVKTRLAATTSDAFAADLYRVCLERVLRALADVEAKRVVYVADAEDRAAMRSLVEQGWQVRAQAEGDLTTRLETAVSQAFDEGAERVVVTATDTPRLGAAQVTEALARLGTRDAVLGPATDGGYYLLGTRRWPVPVFQDIAWSTARVAEQTRQRLRAAGCTWAELEPRPDLDTEDDLRAFLREHPDDPLARWVRADGRLG